MTIDRDTFKLTRASYILGQHPIAERIIAEAFDEPNRGDFFVRLKPPPRRSIEQVMEEVRSKIEAEVPGLEIEPPNSWRT